VKVVFCDLRDHFAVRNALREVQPEVVFHLAAISPVSYSYDHPNEVLEANLLGTVNLAESCLREVPHFKHFLSRRLPRLLATAPCLSGRIRRRRPTARIQSASTQRKNTSFTCGTHISSR
jgi:hypothetical protein